jgi:hypothetical protein
MGVYYIDAFVRIGFGTSSSVDTNLRGAVFDKFAEAF